MSSALAKHAEITALVEKLKAGVISKEELFRRLQELQKGVSAGAPTSTSDGTATAAPSAQAHAAPALKAPSAAIAATVPRQTNAPNVPLTATSSHRAAAVAPPPLPPQQQYAQEQEREYYQQQQLPPSTYSHDATEEHSSWPSAAAPAQAMPQAPPQPPRQEARQSQGRPQSSYGAQASRILSAVAFEDRAAAWARHKEEQQARAAAEAAGRELENCTFKPAINPVSRELTRGRRRSLSNPRGAGSVASSGAMAPPPASSWASSSSEVHERLYRQTTQARTPSQPGASAAMGRADRSMQLLAADASAGINSAGGSNAGAGVGSSSSSARPRSAGASSARGGTSASIRYLQGGRPLFGTPQSGGSPQSSAVFLQRGGLVQLQPDGHWMTEEEARECTFKPKINRSSDAKPVRSRYRNATPSGTRPSTAPNSGGGAGSGGNMEGTGDGAGGGADGLVLPTGMEQCTFRPKTNPVNPSLMPAAAMYVRAPIFERLARTHTQAQRGREQATLGTGAGGSPGAGSSGDEGDDGRSVRSGSAHLSKEERERRHQEFLARQAAAQKKKEEHTEAVAAALAPPLQPQLCARSLEIAQATRQGTSFLERVTNQVARREQEAAKMRARLARDPDCTFQPAINPASRALPPRGADDLSRGDQIKKETAVRLLRLRVEAQQLDGITFAPSINETSRQAQGRLRVLQDPDSYVQRLQAEAALAEYRARAQAEAAHAAELSNCTFHPVVHDAPAYVKRIARSMALARAVRPQSSGPSRPDWR